MRDTPIDQKRTIVTQVNGEIRYETRISFSSTSLVDGEIRVHRAEGNQLDVPVAGADFALRFDLDGVHRVPVTQQAAVEPVEPVPADNSLKLFTSKTVWITLGLWFFVSSVFGWLGIVVAGGYLGYQWREVEKRKKQLAKAPVDKAVTRSGSGMSRESVRKALARRH
ncbi:MULTISPECIES: hypothetical protein [Pseudomonas]|jgi:hypothetical protein|uniref:Uncharacterized protein n=1 Tax=Pseudomonas fluorescens TaxID=294 RepID=A0A423MU59_PSEFL|nr:MULTISPECIES: hypothetical protein [Pseudomonas]EJL99871.1 hypothetical protein PMI19_03883 [Pseudomonas sp. GM16]EJM46670.1 hypothetical protein PMI23_00018 [Pseudomonas sp. GM24]RON88932.1 hypothetical protein BK672_25955 [Pseudomonas fluorescens]